MSDKTKIEWSDATWNPVTGCSKISEGCRNCYALTFAERWRGTPGHYFQNGFDITLRPDKLDQPLKWKRTRKIFVNSMSDLFHDDIPDQFIVDVFSIMAEASQHTFQILTKRPKRMKEFMNDPCMGNNVWLQTSRGVSSEKSEWPLPNVWLGTSVENQKAADERIPLLLETPAAIRFLSCEPMLDLVDISRYIWPVHAHWPSPYRSPEDAKMAGVKVEYKRQRFISADLNYIDWVIVGGESGPRARPMHPEWVRSLRDQCQNAGVSFFFKQWGEWVPVHPDRAPWSYSTPESKCATIDDTRFYRIGKHKAGRLLDGCEWNEFPQEVKP